MPQDKKIPNRDYPLAPTPDIPAIPKGGRYYATPQGRVGRITGSKTPFGGVYSRNTSMDTTGYSKGKENFELSDNSSLEKKKYNVNKKDVPATIERLKKDAKSEQDWKKIKEFSKKKK